MSNRWITALLFSLSTLAFAVEPAATPDTSPLPKQGSIAWNIGFAGWLGNFQDLKDFYGGSLTSDQTPYGAEVDLGMDLAVARSFQIGVQAQGLGRIPETVKFSSGVQHQWRAYTIGGAVVAKYLLPIQDKWNLILHGEGGYYTLVGSGVTAGGSATGTVDMAASNFGGAFMVEGEFLQGEKKNWAMDLGLGYRILRMTPITQSGTYNGFPQSGTLKQANNDNAYIDLSGFRLNATFRFF